MSSVIGWFPVLLVALIVLMVGISQLVVWLFDLAHWWKSRR
jgi:hypothetical protein